MADFRFLVLGVGDAFSAKYYSSGIALRAEDVWLLIDCAHPIRKILSEAAQGKNLSLDIGDFAGVLLTHLHGDHASGLEMFGFYYRYALDGNRAKIIAHPDILANLWDGHLAGSMAVSQKPGEEPTQRSLEDFFEVIPIRETQPVPIGPFSIECRKTIHSIPTTAFRITANGRCLGYSADTAFDPDLISWLNEADLIIHEAGLGGVHTPYKSLLTLPEEIRQKMRLIHYPDSFEVGKSEIEPLKQGGMYQV